MSLTTYFSFALITMGLDAVASYEARVRYRPWRSLVWALLWPLTMVIFLVFAPIRQRRDAAEGKYEFREPWE